LLVGVVGCSVEDPGEPETEAPPVTLIVAASVGSTAVTTLVLEVSGPGIAANLVFNFAVVNGVATGTVTVPAGSGRTFVFRAFDAAGIETHRGSVTMDVRPGGNPGLSIVLAALAGELPIEVQLGTVRIAVAPSADTLAIGDSVVLTARVTDAEGNPVSQRVQWATLGPNVAVVAATSDSTGLVKAVGPGQTLVVATLGGVAGAASIVVSPDPTLIEVASGLTAPLYVTSPPGDSDRVFVVEQSGRIRVIRNDTLLSTPFLDIASLVTFSGEQGLLSMAFHPAYAANGYFFVDYTDTNGDTRVVRYRVSSDPNVADAASAQEILFVEQPFANHNGGLVMFGPDGYLYVGLGDGGSGGDPFGHGQDSTTLLGSILRIDVDGGFPYVIPPINPFAGHPSARPEIWAYGLRNPWRFSFDRVTRDLYIADVGQGAREEINFQPAASGGRENYGWNIMEGTQCFDPPTGCNQAGLELPVHEYDHSIGCSVIGGYAYRGNELPVLYGRYFYSDFCSGWIRSFRVENGVAVGHVDHTGQVGGGPGSVTSMGEDERGRLYVTTVGGRVLRLAPAR
jgi:glucose/arabinose dehydrogenase